MIDKEIFENKNFMYIEVIDTIIVVKVFSNLNLIDSGKFNISNITTIKEFFLLYRNKHFIYLEKNMITLNLFINIFNAEKIWAVVLERTNCLNVLLLEKSYDYQVFDEDFFITSNIILFIKHYCIDYTE